MARCILIADDSSSMRHMLRDACERLGDVEIAEAADGLDAVKRLATGRFDLMFVDINMPLLDGLKLVQRVRLDRRHQGTRICVCTTEFDCEDQARQLGADFFLSKPVARAALDQLLHACFPGTGGSPPGPPE